MSNTILFWLILVSGFYLVLFSLIVKSNDYYCLVLFRVIPFFLGLGSLFSAFKLIGLI